MDKLLLTYLFLWFGGVVFAQTVTDELTGRVQDASGTPLTGIHVVVEGTTRGALTDADGMFTIERLPRGRHTLVISGIGFQEIKVPVEYPQVEFLRITLEEDVRELSEVLIRGNQRTAEVKATGLNVSVINAERFQDFNVDINQLLGLTSGVKLREAGGLGSSFQLALNGLSGNQVRYFLDGVPMEFFGSALSLNNMPANLIRSVEVYKGVVPVELASDALGGSINVIPAAPTEEFLDVSYSFGSFNTHRAAVVAQVKSESDLFVNFSSYFNHSDNNYWMDDVPVTDDLGNISSEERVRRFHDEYTSAAIHLKAGVLNKAFADELSASFSIAGNSNNIQHPDVSINRVFGGLNTRNESYLGGLRYRKAFGRTDLEANLLAGDVEEVFYDTLSRRYNWDGTYRPLSGNSGEYYQQRSVFHLQDRIFRGNLRARHTLNARSNIDFNVAHSRLNRSGYDEINENNRAYTFPNELAKNILGAAWNYESLSGKLRGSLFAKHYYFSGRINTEEYISGSYQNVETETDLSKMGYGLTAFYTFQPGLSAKFSYEKAYRMPEPDEILGDGMFVDPNPQLQAESSHNLNLGLVYNRNTGDVRLNSETYFFFRPADNFIRFVNDRGIYGSFYNVANVRILGLETSNYVRIQNKYLAGVNLTYQSITDRTEFYEGLPNTNYGNKIPNTPYFFWNLWLGYQTDVGETGRLSATWTATYVHEFFLYWEHLGFRDDKNMIPTQFLHDLDVNYAFMDGKYSAALSVRNLFDAQAYDNFNIQKPGRAFYLKLRYNLNFN